MRADQLLVEIEKHRTEMIVLSELYGMTSKIVIQASEKLDILLHQYHKLNVNTYNLCSPYRSLGS